MSVKRVNVLFKRVQLVTLNIWFKEQSVQVTRACAKQFEFILAQRIRRSVQIFNLYTRIWDEVALREFMKSWTRRVIGNSKHFLIASVGVTMYNWDQERISDDEIKRSYSLEIDGIHRLKENTVVCQKCQLRIMFDKMQPNIKYCECTGSKTVLTSNQDLDGWQPFIERKDMLIWKRQETDSGLFAYKVYGSFPDVTANDFLQVQIDVDYRKQWDSTAHELKIVETDPITKSSRDHSTDVVYWEMIWPRLFSNRDYVYQRRWVVDKEKRIIVIVSKGTDHPNVPNKPGVFRVTTYWSYMVIKPYQDFDKPGIEFGLTYFDDPGTNVPSAVTSWVALSGLPDFLSKMREASKDYQKYKATIDDTLSDKNTIEEEVANEMTHEKINSAEKEGKTSETGNDSYPVQEDEVKIVELTSNGNNLYQTKNEDTNSSVTADDKG